MVGTECDPLELSKLSPDEVFDKFGSKPEGLDEESVVESRTKYGVNVLSNPDKHPIIRRIFNSFVNVFTLLLAIVAAFNYYLDPSPIFVSIIAFLILLSGTMTYIQESRSNKAAAKLAGMITKTVSVYRNGKMVDINSADLVVGDVVFIDTGDVAAADLRIVENCHINVDQSSLTGESEMISKDDAPDCEARTFMDCKNMIYASSHVTRGSAKAIVTAVGDNTVIGKMASGLAKKKTKAEFDKRSKSIVNLQLKIMVIATTIIFAVFFIKGQFNGMPILNNVMSSLSYALALGSGLLPELLATIMSTALAKGGLDMAKKKVIVKDPKSIQNIGAIDVLCSDKTGTLTQNKVSVTGYEDCFGG